MNIAYIKNIKPYTNYTDKQIIDFTNLATNPHEYDYIIDKLYFTDTNRHRKHLKNRCEYSVITATMETKRRRKDNITAAFIEGRI